MNDKPSDLELVAGGAAAIALIALGVTLVYKALNESGDTSSDLEDTSSLAALATVVPL